MVYPSDDGPIRLRLLITECRAARLRLQVRIDEIQDAQAKRLEAGTAPEPAPPPVIECEDHGGGES